VTLIDHKQKQGHHAMMVVVIHWTFDGSGAEDRDSVGLRLDLTGLTGEDSGNSPPGRDDFFKLPSSASLSHIHPLLHFFHCSDRDFLTQMIS
jgi:hypothetical protein